MGLLIAIVQRKENTSELLGKGIEEKGCSVKILATSQGLSFPSFGIPTFSALPWFPTQLMNETKAQNRTVRPCIGLCARSVLHR